MELLRSGLPSYYYICKLQTEYDMENRLTVGFTHGDVNGIGYELNPVEIALERLDAHPYNASDPRAHVLEASF